jgi:excisionase family DNA binding protein
MLIYAYICIIRHMENMHSINDICQQLGVARGTVHDWIATKQLKAFHFGGKRLTRVCENDLFRFAQGRPKSRNR